MPSPKNKDLNRYLLVLRPLGHDPTENLLTVAEVAAMRGVGYESCIREIWMGRLPAWSVAGLYLIPRKAAEDWANRPKQSKGQQKALQRVNRAADTRAKQALQEARVVYRTCDPAVERYRFRNKKEGEE